MSYFTSEEEKMIFFYFEIPLKELTKEVVENKRKLLRKKYHPDNYESFEDDELSTSAHRHFTTVEALCDKLLNDEYVLPSDTEQGESHGRSIPFAYAYNDLRIDVITSNKDLKYKLFGRQMKWLLIGESYNIPGTSAQIIIDSSFSGHSIGYTETIPMYLAFSELDHLEHIMLWLFVAIADEAQLVKIDNEVCRIDYTEMLRAVKIKSKMQLE